MKNQFAISKIRNYYRSILNTYRETKKINKFEIYVKNKEIKRRKIIEIYNNAFK